MSHIRLRSLANPAGASKRLTNCFDFATYRPRRRFDLARLRAVTRGARQIASSGACPMPEPVDPVALTADLVRCPSVTPAEAGTMAVLERALQAAG